MGGGLGRAMVGESGRGLGGGGPGGSVAGGAPGGLLWDKKWVKNGSKMSFPKNDPRPFGVPKQVK